MQMTASPSPPLEGTAAVPGDKSISHRALILGAMAIGETRIEGLLEGEDVLATAAAVRALGAQAERQADGAWLVHGVGTGGFCEPEDVIDCGNAGTGVRLLMGAVATHGFDVTFTGDASLRSRPMGRVLEPLAAFGTRAAGRSGGRLPLTLIGARDPVPVHHALTVPSAQVKSAVLLAGVAAPGETSVLEPEPTRDHTERMLRGFGAGIVIEEAEGGRLIRLMGLPELEPCTIRVPRDPSSAAFPLVAALTVPGSEVRIPGVSRNPTRDGLVRTLLEMGADIAAEDEREEGGEPVADLVARHGPLRGVAVPPDRAASMIDEFPILAVAAAHATGVTRMEGIGEMRVKESDRIAATEAALAASGVAVRSGPDWMEVEGRGTVPGGGTASTHLDHRIAMSALVLGLGAEAPVSVDDARPIATSFPDFARLMGALGAPLSSDGGARG